MDKKEQTLAELQTIGCLALGYVIGKDGLTGPLAKHLAEALRKSGVESAYINAVLGPEPREASEIK